MVKVVPMLLDLNSSPPALPSPGCARVLRRAGRRRRLRAATHAISLTDGAESEELRDGVGLSLGPALLLAHLLEEVAPTHLARPRRPFFLLASAGRICYRWSSSGTDGVATIVVRRGVDLLAAPRPSPAAVP